MSIMVCSVVMTPRAAMLMPNTQTVVEDCTRAVRSADTAKASGSETPVHSIIAPNHGWSASGMADSLTSTRPRMIMAPPNTASARARNRFALPLTMSTLVTPSR